MTYLFTVLVALFSAFVISEIALRGTKLQTGLSRVLIVWTLVYLAMVAVLFTMVHSGLVACTIFWGGAFLSWFGVRSHIESSILMRMMFVLRRRPMTAQELLEEYQSHYGEGMRLAELARGNLIASADDTRVTIKGKNILRIVAMLK